LNLKLELSYSLLKLSVGLLTAALIACALTVTNVITIAAKPESAKDVQVISM
jgi:hypothetical protein